MPFRRAAGRGAELLNWQVKENRPLLMLRCLGRFPLQWHPQGSADKSTNKSTCVIIIKLLIRIYIYIHTHIAIYVVICIYMYIYIYIFIFIFIPVVPHKAVAEVSKIGSL